MRNNESFVCGKCFNDIGIQAEIEKNAVSTECSFCSETSDIPFAAAIEDVAMHISERLHLEYGDAESQLLIDREEEGGYYGDNWNTAELLLDVLEVDLPNDTDRKLLSELLGLIEDNAWCEIDAYGLDDQNRTRFSWALFCEVVMHRRQFFLKEYVEEHPGETYSPGEVLGKLFEDSERYDLFQDLPAGTRLFRARFQEPGTRLTTAQELGPPPKRLSNQSNRMSPPGIAMFYGSMTLQLLSGRLLARAASSQLDASRLAGRPRFST